MLFILLSTLLSFSHAGENHCYDQKGQLVKTIYDNKAQHLAVALEKAGMASKTITNPILMKQFTPQTQAFIQWHECGHHSLGHLLSNKATTMIQEQESDCFGIRVALTLGQIQHYDLDSIRKEVANIGPGDWQHLSGPTRSLNIQKCLGEGYKKEPWRVCKEKFYSNLDTFKNAIPALEKMLSLCDKLGSKSSQCVDAKNLSQQLHQGLANSTARVDQECPYVMDPIFTKTMFEYGKVFMKLNNYK